MPRFKDITNQRFGKLVALERTKVVNGHSYWLCKCDCGNTKEVNISELTKGKTKSCGCLRRKDLTGQRFGLLTCLKMGESFVRENGIIKTTWVCRCDCGNTVTFQTESLQSGRAYSCGCKSNKGHRIDLTGQKFGKLTAIKPISRINESGNYTSQWECQCDCGNTTIAYTNNLLRGTVNSCGCLLKELGLEQTKYMLGQRFGKLVVLERIENLKNNGNNDSIKYKCKCDCGGIVIVRSSDLKSGRTQSCGCIKSIGEEKISNWLKGHNINFIRQYTIKDMLFSETKHHPVFDFAIFNDNNDLLFLIEYQGIQHYKHNSKGWNNLENHLKTKQRDLEKKKLCEDFNLKLIEIPYWDLPKIEEKLEEIFK